MTELMLLHQLPVLTAAVVRALFQARDSLHTTDYTVLQETQHNVRPYRSLLMTPTSLLALGTLLK